MFEGLYVANSKMFSPLSIVIETAASLQMPSIKNRELITIKRFAVDSRWRPICRHRFSFLICRRVLYHQTLIAEFSASSASKMCSIKQIKSGHSLSTNTTNLFCLTVLLYFGVES